MNGCYFLCLPLGVTEGTVTVRTEKHLNTVQVLAASTSGSGAARARPLAACDLNYQLPDGSYNTKRSTIFFIDYQVCSGLSLKKKI